MSKVATKMSGILTLVFFTVVLVFSLAVLGNQFNVDFSYNFLMSIDFLKVICNFVLDLFILIPSKLITLLISSVELGLLQHIFLSLLVAFSVLMVFWGIKEIVISNRDDVDFANCKKTCGFMFFTKFMFFAYVAFVIAGSFLIETIKNFVDDFNVSNNVNNGFLIYGVAFAVIALLLFLLPTINVLSVAKKVNNDSNTNKMAGENFETTVNTINTNDVQELDQFYKSSPKPTMQANMPPLPGFNSNVSTFQQTANQQETSNINQGTNLQNSSTVINQNPQSQSASQVGTSINQQSSNSTAYQTNVQPTNQQTNSVGSTVAPSATNQSNLTQNTNIQPQQNNSVNTSVAQPNLQPNTNIQVNSNGANNQQGDVQLSEKAQADLSRLDRLKNMGAITDENYEAMKKKILEGN